LNLREYLKKKKKMAQSVVELARRILAAADETEVLAGCVLPFASALTDVKVNAYFRRIALRLHPDKLATTYTGKKSDAPGQEAVPLSAEDLVIIKEAFERCLRARLVLGTAAARKAFDEVHRRANGRNHHDGTGAMSTSMSTSSLIDAEFQRKQREEHSRRRATDLARKMFLDPLAAVDRQLADEKRLFEGMYGNARRKRQRE
jgi:hypothetical protein